MVGSRGSVAWWEGHGLCSQMVLGSIFILSAYWLCDLGQVTSLCLNILIWQKGLLHPTLQNSWEIKRTWTYVKCLAHNRNLAGKLPSFQS